MFLALRHPAIVGRHHQHDGIDTAGTGDHVLDEALMPGHVDKGDALATLDLAKSKTEIDGHATVLLLGQAVRVGSRQPSDDGRFTVIDVSGGPQDQHGRILPQVASISRMEFSSVSRSSSATALRSRMKRSASTRPITGRGSSRKRRIRSVGR